MKVVSQEEEILKFYNDPLNHESKKVVNKGYLNLY